jgi:hypothetical protein
MTIVLRGHDARLLTPENLYYALKYGSVVAQSPLLCTLKCIWSYKVMSHETK